MLPYIALVLLTKPRVDIPRKRDTVVVEGADKLETSEASGVVKLSAPVGVVVGTWLSNVDQYVLEVIAVPDGTF
jgi:hypothetical protein